MIKIWFLVILMSYPNTPSIAYKGFGGFFEKSECEEKKVFAENMITDYEIRRGNTVHIETFCLEMEIFKSQIKKKKELNSTGFEA